VYAIIIIISSSSSSSSSRVVVVYGRLWTVSYNLADE
jgi:hypothetical protein